MNLNEDVIYRAFPDGDPRQRFNMTSKIVRFFDADMLSAMTYYSRTEGLKGMEAVIPTALFMVAMGPYESERINELLKQIATLGIELEKELDKLPENHKSPVRLQQLFEESGLNNNELIERLRAKKRRPSAEDEEMLAKMIRKMMEEDEEEVKGNHRSDDEEPVDDESRIKTESFFNNVIQDNDSTEDGLESDFLKALREELKRRGNSAG